MLGAGTQRLRLSRAQLASFLKDFESVKQFEVIIDVINDVIETGDGDPYAVASPTARVQIEPYTGSEPRVVIDNRDLYLGGLGTQPRASQLVDPFEAPFTPPTKSPKSQLIYGTGPGYTSSPDLTYDPTTGLLVNNLVTLPKAAGYGVKVDLAAPTFPWQDQIGTIQARGTGPTDPSLATYRNGVKQYQFTVNDEVWIEFHLTHDYLPGSDLFIHAHWSYVAASMTSGGVVWGFETTSAKGHQQQAFGATVTPTAAQTAVVSGSGGQYMHHIAEVQLSSSSPTATQINNNTLEPDTIILVRCFLQANTLQGTPEPFLHYCDLHYQSTGVGTKQKAPSFYT